MEATMGRRKWKKEKKVYLCSPREVYGSNGGGGGGRRGKSTFSSVPGSLFNRTSTVDRFTYSTYGSRRRQDTQFLVRCSWLRARGQRSRSPTACDLRSYYIFSKSHTFDKVFFFQFLYLHAPAAPPRQ